MSKSKQTEINGKYNTAIVYTSNIEESATEQIQSLCNQPFFSDSKIRIMPDVHAGAGCTIGTTMIISNKVVPNLVGVDIGCGMYCVKLNDIEINLQQIDEYIHNSIPHGFNINEHAQVNFKEHIQSLHCFRELKKSSSEFNRAIGSLGGGNHFIEINIDTNNNKYLVIHTGSRNLGHKVAMYYQNKAYEYHTGQDEQYELSRTQLIEEYKSQGRRKEIQVALQHLKNSNIKEINIPKELCYLEGKFMKSYLHDIAIVQQYSSLNRTTIARKIIEDYMGINLSQLEQFETIHNYIDIDNMILRKGAVSAQKNEKLLVPINMRDGSLICLGKGNSDWNYSAPHGAGRLMSRTLAKENVTLEQFKQSMTGIFTSCVSEDTLDESPFAYKTMQEIIDNTQTTVEIIDIIKPIYNFKSSNG